MEEENGTTRDEERRIEEKPEEDVNTTPEDKQEEIPEEISEAEEAVDDSDAKQDGKEEEEDEKPVELSAELKSALDSVYTLGLVAEGELDSRAMDAIKELLAEEVIAIFDEFKASNLEHVSNKSAFLCGLIKSHRQKVRKLKNMHIPGRKLGPDETKLKEILERTKYTLDVSTGQRKYGGPPPDWTGTPPGPGHEIYCGRIPKDLFEDTLIPLFENYGPIWDIRLMMDPISGRNRGYCFVTYVEKKSADDSVLALNNFEIKPGKLLRVNASVANVRLFIGNIPKNRTRDEILQEFQKHTEGLVDVIVYSSPDDSKKKNRGFAFLDYDSHKSASAAKRHMSSSRVHVWGLQVLVDWADPQEEPNEETMSMVKVLYVRNLKSDTTEVQLKETFEPYGAIDRVKKVKGYGFVHFSERDAALKAMQELNGHKLADLEMEISLAKPLTRNRQKNSRKKHFGMYSYAGYDDSWNNYPARFNPRRGHNNKMTSYDYYSGYTDDYYYQQGYDASPGYGSYDYYGAGGRYGTGYAYYSDPRYASAGTYSGQKQPWYQSMGSQRGWNNHKNTRSNTNTARL